MIVQAQGADCQKSACFMNSQDVGSRMIESQDEAWGYIYMGSLKIC